MSTNVRNLEELALLVKAQNGDKFAEEDLINMIKTQHMMKRISRYMGKNRQVENEDLKQEFLIGVALSLKEAKINVGDPVEFIIFKGLCRVKSFMRKQVVQSTRQICLDCGTKSRLNRDKSSDGYICRKCGSKNINTDEINDNNEVTLMSISTRGFEEDLISELTMSDFKSTLIEGTNVYKLYELLESGIDRDNPMIKNYIKEIATLWGTSNQNVVQNLNKLKTRIEKFMMDECSSVAI